MSLLLLFRPKSGIGGAPEPEPPPVVVSSGVRKKKRYLSVSEFENRETLEKFIKGQLARNLPQEQPNPLRERQAREDQKRLKAQQKREAEMRRQAAEEQAALEAKAKSVQAYNQSVMEIIARILELDDDA